MKEIQHKKLLLNRRGEEMETWKCMKVVLMTRSGVALCVLLVEMTGFVDQ